MSNTLFVRKLNLFNLLQKKSFFLFGPRATGKSFLIAQQFPKDIPIIDLLSTDIYLRLLTNPSLLESIIFSSGNPKIVIIDEVQRIPALLNEVHRLIEKKQIRFLLTGSSARSLRKQHANLLAGRARRAELFPLTSDEIPNFSLDRYLKYGGLPSVYLSDAPQEDLLAYVDTYLKEEIAAESVVRRLPEFSRFLQFSAITSGQMINFSNLANDAAVSANTIREYYHILEDTFIGFMLPAWRKSIKRKAISTAKFYYFDLGVKNCLARIKHLEPASDLYGKTFEHFIALELRAYISYARKNVLLSYWQAKNGQEVDFIIEDDIGIEIKTTTKVHNKHLKGLQALCEENICKDYYLVSFDNIKRKQDQITILPWQDFLQKLWRGEIF